jgi:predicted glycoside hydrolase/deacetylase ChbG (UPF0249 family)
VKQLVFNADDFGLNAAVNAAVAQAHTQGMLTSASLMITAPAAAEAVEFAKAHPQLGVGLHLCLVQGPGQPASPFVLSRQLSCRGVLGRVEAELREQLRLFLAAGLRPTHLDSHMHTHLHAQVLEIVIRLARENGIAFVRAPVEPVGPSLCTGGGTLHKLARAAVFGTLGSRAKRRLRAAGLQTADRAVGVLNPGRLDERFLEKYVPRLPDGVTEIFCHPAVGESAAVARGQSGYRHRGELEALCSTRLRELIHDAGIVLKNFRDLAAQTSG